MSEPAHPAAEISQNPYVGPRAFEQEERNLFFGRDEEIEILTSLVMTRRSALFYAQSGAGKSSLLRAGLIPELTCQRTVGHGRRQRVYQRMRVLPIATVGGAVPKEMARPIANIYIFSALYTMQPNANPNDLAGLTLSAGLASLLKDEQEQEPGDQQAAEQRRRARPSLSTLLIFDQFEEIFTTHVHCWPERKAFFEQIRQALKDHQTLHVLFAMREDYIAELTPYLNLMPEQLRDRFRMERLRREAAIQAVKEPAVQAGRKFADGVAEDLVDNLRHSQAGQKGKEVEELRSVPKSETYEAYVEPVHLQIVCHQLWDQVDKLPDKPKTIEIKHMTQFGDVDKALIDFYESTLKTVIEKIGIGERRLRDWFASSLITSSGTRGLVYKDEKYGRTKGLPNTAIDILNDAYIIRAEIRGSDTWYELTHDRLVAPILEANRDWELKQLKPDLRPTDQRFTDYPTDQRFTDLEIRILQRKDAGYPVQITLGGQQESSQRYLSADILPWIPSSDLTTDGQRLFDTLFADGVLHSAWIEARGQAPERRIRLHIDPAAAELHALPWELLQENDVMLSAQANTPFSRYLSVALPWSGAVEEFPIRVLVAISNPDDLAAKYSLAPLDVVLERRIMESALEKLDSDKLAVDFLDPPVTLERLEALWSGYHVLHYLGHGRFNQRLKQAILYLQDDAGHTHVTIDDAIIGMLARQQVRPRLVFLAACQSVTRDIADAFAGLGPKLVNAGIPAIVAMQDTVEITTAQKLSAVFYQRLAEHGTVDLALNEARSTLLAARQDAAMPVLFMRLKSGQLWGGEADARGWMLNAPSRVFWRSLTRNIEAGRCTPIIGPRVHDRWLPTPAEIARKWSELHEYPFSNKDELAYVAQYLVGHHGETFTRHQLLETLQTELVERMPEGLRPNYGGADRNFYDHDCIVIVS